MESLKKFSVQLGYATLEGLMNFWRGGWMSWIVISTMVVALSVLGGFWLIIKDINYISHNVSSKVKIMVFLTEQVSLEDVSPKIEQIEGVMSLNQITKEQAWEEMKQNMQGKMNFSNLISNPLPDTIEVTVVGPEYVENVVDQIAQIPGIEDVRYSQELVLKLKEINQTLKLVGIFITAVLTIATMAIIINTVRLAIYSYQEEIEIMRLVGGPNWFVSFPFILQGIVFGLISGVLTGFILGIWRIFTINQVQKLFAFLPIQDDFSIVWKISFWLLPIGVVIGIIASLVSINRYLGFEKSVE